MRVLQLMPMRRGLTLASVPILVSMLFGGCAVSPLQEEAQILAPIAASELSRAAEYEQAGQYGTAAAQYASLAKGATPPARAQLELKAASAYLKAGRMDEANRLLGALANGELTTGQRELLLLTQAELALLNDRPSDAIRGLERMSSGLPLELETRRLGALAAAHRLSGDLVAAAEALNRLDGKLTDPQQRALSQVSLVATLELLDESRLQALRQGGDGALKGWVELALITRGSGSNAQGLANSYQQWKQRHAGHPALPNFPQAYTEVVSGGYAAGEQLTVLLPTSGRFAAVAKVIRDGIEAARAADQSGKRPSLEVISSATGSAPSLHARATAAGADYLIGPLQKDAVDALAAGASTMAVPTLALNQTTDVTKRADNLYQFSLSPENEAAEAAAKAFAMGKRRALLLFPQGAWGERMAGAFRNHWSSLGGAIVGQATFDPGWKTYDKTIKTLLGRGDADLVFLAATFDAALRIYPSVQQIAGKPLTVIATSHVYSGTLTSAQSQTLDGLYFVDIPWMLDIGGSGPLSRQARSGGGSGALARLFAMGVDAYRLAPRLQTLAATPGAYYPAQTGGVSIDGLGRIRRQLALGRFTAQGPRLAAVNVR